MGREKNNESIHATVANVIRKKIFKGELNPGDILPSENDLCAQYSASRETIRRSLKALEYNGLIRAVPGKGYFVSEPVHDKFIVNFKDNVDGYRNKLKWVKVVHPSEELQQALKVQPSDRVVEICSIFFSSEGPVMIYIKYLAFEIGQPTVESLFKSTYTPELASGETEPFSYSTRMEVTAETATGVIKELLKCAESEPLLVVRRFLVGQNKKYSYGVHYMKQPFGKLSGFSGYLPDKNFVIF